MYCSSCGRKLEDTALYCSGCGKRTDVREAPPVEDKETSAPAVLSGGFSMCIGDVVFITGGAVLIGSVASGELKAGDKVKIRTANGSPVPECGEFEYVISNLSLGGVPVAKVSAGDKASLFLNGLGRIYGLEGRYVVASESGSRSEGGVSFRAVMEEMAGQLSGRGTVGKEEASAIQDMIIDTVAGQVSGNPIGKTIEEPDSVPDDVIADTAVELPPVGPVGNPYDPTGDDPPVTDAPDRTAARNRAAENDLSNDISDYELQDTINNIGSLTMLGAQVGIKSGKGPTILSAMNTGRLTVTPEGVTYKAQIGVGGQSNSHTYSLDQVADTSFKITRAGVQPVLSYTVTLKTGCCYTYIYSLFQKNRMYSIDAMIRRDLNNSSY